MDYGEGSYYDEEMNNLLFDADERECMDEAAFVQAEIDADEEWMREQAIPRMPEQMRGRGRGRKATARGA